MIKTITKVGNSRGIILDSALLEMAHLKEGDQLSVTVHESGTLTFTPMHREVIDEQTAASRAAALISQNHELFDRLSK
jgi:antitoxin component of MazEF toxin-antitoxin module